VREKWDDREDNDYDGFGDDYKRNCDGVEL